MISSSNPQLKILSLSEQSYENQSYLNIFILVNKPLIIIGPVQNQFEKAICMTFRLPGLQDQGGGADQAWEEAAEFLVNHTLPKL